jgi:protease I
MQQICRASCRECGRRVVIGIVRSNDVRSGLRQRRPGDCSLIAQEDFRMSDTRRLKGRRIAALAADGFEKLELSIPLRAMQVAGAHVDVISLRRGRIRGVNLHEPASRIHVEKTVQEAKPADYDALLIPGGYINPDLLRQSSDARDFARAFATAHKPIATLCHGPWVLASAGLLRGRTLTSWPGIRDDMVNAGAIWLDQPTVRDGNLLTSRGPQDLVPFVRELLEHFADHRDVQIAISRVNASTSAPQRDQPPSVVLSAMRWIPRPSLRTAIGLIALVIGLGALRTRRFA